MMVKDLEKVYIPSSFETEDFYVPVIDSGELTINAAVNIDLEISKSVNEAALKIYNFYYKIKIK